MSRSDRQINVSSCEIKRNKRNYAGVVKHDIILNRESDRLVKNYLENKYPELAVFIAKSLANEPIYIDKHFDTNALKSNCNVESVKKGGLALDENYSVMSVTFKDELLDEISKIKTNSLKKVASKVTSLEI